MYLLPAALRLVPDLTPPAYQPAVRTEPRPGTLLRAASGNAPARAAGSPPFDHCTASTSTASPSPSVRARAMSPGLSLPSSTSRARRLTTDCWTSRFKGRALSPLSSSN